MVVMHELKPPKTMGFGGLATMFHALSLSAAVFFSPDAALFVGLGHPRAGDVVFSCI